MTTQEQDKVRRISDARARKQAAKAAKASDSTLRVVDRMTDLGNAERLIGTHGADLRYVGTWARWLVWDGCRWASDTTCQVAARCADVARLLMGEATAALAATCGGKEAEHLYRFAKDTQESKRLDGMAKVARALPGVAIAHGQLDADPWALNVANGILDLRTGTLRAHDRAALMTKLAPVAFDADAECPTWDAFLLRAMGGDVELVAYLRRMIGYTLTGLVREHVLGFFFGGGQNGKSTFLLVMHALFGDYGARAPRGLLFRNQGSQHETSLTTLFGARFVSCAEIDEKDAFDEALVKDLTGGDPISARRMREDFWTFDPSHKLFLAGNHRPIVRGTDEGIWRRIRLIPWTVEIPKPERDTELPAKLFAELPGILAWAVRGCLEWQAHGLGEPIAVSEATAAYRESSDPLREFFEGHCVFGHGDRAPTVARRHLREAYEAWCKENGAEPLGAKRFSEGLRVRGVTDTSVRAPKPVDGWRGVRLKTDFDQLQDGGFSS